METLDVPSVRPSTRRGAIPNRGPRIPTVAIPTGVSSVLVRLPSKTSHAM